MEQVWGTVASDSTADGVAALEESSLSAMLARAKELDASERAPFVTRVTVRLRALGKAPADERRAAADAVLALLDQSAFDGLVDGSGRPAHAAAVEAVLALGYPHALRVRPEDLERYREVGTEGATHVWRVPLALVLLGVGVQTGGFLRGAGSLGQAVHELGAVGVVGLFTYLAMGLGAGASFFASPRGRWHRWARRALLVSGAAFGVVLGLTVAALPSSSWLSTLQQLGVDLGLVAAATAGALWPRTKRLPAEKGD